MTTFTWNGGSASAGDPTQWTPNGTPGPGDSAIVTSGTVLGGSNTQINNATLYLGGTSGITAAFVTGGDSIVNFMTPTLDFTTVLTSAVPGASTAESSLLVAAGRFINQGTIDANGPAGSTFTIQVTTDGTVPGTFINYSQISVESGNAMVIDIAGTSELANVGVVQTNGGTLVINAATNAIAGGYAPFAGIAIIDGGGTLETNAGYATTVGGVPPTYAFADQTAGNTLKIDNVGSFAGAIIGFGVSDTIDVGTSLAVGQLAYNVASGILNLENAGGTILASLIVRGSDFQTGTAALSGGSALGFNIGTGAAGDTIITTGSLNDLSTNISGTWQTAGNWTNGVPGTLDSTFVGVNAHTDFTLTTGLSAVQVGPLYVVDHHATLQFTSDTTINSNTLTDFGGTAEVTGGNTLTTQGIRQTGGSIIVDPAATLNLTGSPPFNFIPSNGTLSVTSSNTLAARVAGGSVLVNGGTLNAAPSAGGGGGHIDIGIDGSGTPATVTAQSSGTNAAVVTDTFAQVGADPTSSGVLTLSGNVTWTDAIDSHDTSTNSGMMFVGIDNVAGNIPAGVPKPPFTNSATLLVENGATLIDQRSAQIGASVDSAGAATIASGGIWNVGTGGIGFAVAGSSAGTLTVTDANSLVSDAGGMNVGLAGGGQGVLQILNGGTIRMTGTGGITVANSAGSTGTLVVTGTLSQLDFNATAKGITVGNSGQGTLAVSNGGTIALTGTGGLLLGSLAGASGTVDVSGPGALIAYGTTAGGLTVGGAGTGLLDIENGGTVLMDSTSGVPIGQSAGGSGLIVVNGTNSLLNVGTNSTGIGVGLIGTGSLQVTGGGTVTIGPTSAGHGALNIGDNATAVGTVTVSGTGSSITTVGTNGFVNVGVPGTGVLNIDAGGLVSSSAGVFIGTGGTSVSKGTVTVDNGKLTTTAGMSVGRDGTGALTVQNGGTASSSGLNVGFNAGSQGTLVVNAGGTLNTGAGGALSDINATGTGHAGAAVGGGIWNVGGQLIVGDTGNGSLDINSNGIVNAGSNSIDIGNQSGGSGTFAVNSGQLLDSTGQIFIASPAGSNGTLAVSTGGFVSTNALIVGTGGFVEMNGGTLQVFNPAGIQNSGSVGGVGTVEGGINGSGGISVGPGALVFTGVVNGTGIATIDGGGRTLEAGSGVGSGQTINFGGANSALRLDSVVGSNQGFVVTNWQNTDELIVANGVTVTGANWLNGAATTGTLEVDTTGGPIDFTSVTLAPGTFPIFNTGSNFVELVSCFAAGTRIASDDGETLVETLRIGERVKLANGALDCVTWVGHRTIDCRRHPDPRLVWPVRIRAHAFGPGCPKRDLWLSPDHALFVDGVLIPAKYLIDGVAIAQVRVDSVRYYHVELSHHDVLLAEGLPAESYLAAADRGAFSRRDAPVALFPDLASRVWEAEGCAPLVVSGPALDAARRRIAGRRRAAA